MKNYKELKNQNDRYENLLLEAEQQRYSELTESEIRSMPLTSGSCINSPLPVTPTGTVWQERLSYSGDTFDIKVWRIGCDATNSNVLVRIYPVSTDVFICSSRFKVIQNADQYDVKLTDSPNGVSFCDDLFIPKTFLLEQWSFNLQFKDDAAFTLFWDRQSDKRLNIDAYLDQSSGCSQGGITTYSPSTGIVKIPSVELPSGKCYNVEMQRIAPFENLDFTVTNAILTQ